MCLHELNSYTSIVVSLCSEELCTVNSTGQKTGILFGFCYSEPQNPVQVTETFSASVSQLQLLGLQNEAKAARHPRYYKESITNKLVAKCSNEHIIK